MYLCQLLCVLFIEEESDDIETQTISYPLKERKFKKNSTHIFFVSVLLHSFLFIKFCFPLFEHIFTIQKHGERKYDG